MQPFQFALKLKLEDYEFRSTPLTNSRPRAPHLIWCTCPMTHYSVARLAMPWPGLVMKVLMMSWVPAWTNLIANLWAHFDIYTLHLLLFTNSCVEKHSRLYGDVGMGSNVVHVKVKAGAPPKFKLISLVRSDISCEKNKEVTDIIYLQEKTETL